MATNFKYRRVPVAYTGCFKPSHKSIYRKDNRNKLNIVVDSDDFDNLTSKQANSLEMFNRYTYRDNDEDTPLKNLYKTWKAYRRSQYK